MNKKINNSHINDDQSRFDSRLVGPEVGRPILRITPVVLAGGSGSRLWPISREQYPKQLIDIVGPDSLLQSTVQRICDFPGQREVVTPIIVCGDDHRFMTEEQIQASGVQAKLIAEPVRRGTAPALTLAAAVAGADGKDSIIVAMPADHVITDLPAFQRAVELAARHAENG